MKDDKKTKAIMLEMMDDSSDKGRHNENDLMINSTHQELSQRALNWREWEKTFWKIIASVTNRLRVHGYWWWTVLSCIFSLPYASCVVLSLQNKANTFTKWIITSTLLATYAQNTKGCSSAFKSRKLLHLQFFVREVASLFLTAFPCIE